MRLSGNTILITGGPSGIGLELATQFAALDNTVIVTGRTQSKLDAARKKLPAVHAIQSDASDPAAIDGLSVKPMNVTVLVRHALDGIERDRLEIRPGLANMLKIMSCVAPNFLVRQLGRSVDRMLAQQQ